MRLRIVDKLFLALRLSYRRGMTSSWGLWGDGEWMRSLGTGNRNYAGIIVLGRHFSDEKTEV